MTVPVSSMEEILDTVSIFAPKAQPGRSERSKSSGWRRERDAVGENSQVTEIGFSPHDFQQHQQRCHGLPIYQNNGHSD